MSLQSPAIRPLIALGLATGLATALACGGISGSDDVLGGPVVIKTDGTTPVSPTGGTWCEDPVARVDLWVGEYPEPIINLTEDMEFPSRSNPCLKAPDTTCRVEKGLYHPWAKGDGFVTIQAQTAFTASKPIELGDPPMQVKKGDTVIRESYLAEGYCMMSVGGKSIEAMCPGMDDDGLVEGKKSSFQPIQLLNPGCGSWVVIDPAFLAQPEVKRGQVVEYGKVGE